MVRTWRGFIDLAGILVVAVDYRNFPQGDIEDMKQDINQSLAWTQKVEYLQRDNNSSTEY